MNKNELSIATITWARDADEENLLRRSLQQLATLEIPVFITDGGSDPAFLDFLRSFPHFVLLEAKTKGLWAQAKTSLLAAYESGSGFILYTEPDKHDFFRDGLTPMLDRLEVNAQTGIITASRSPKGFASFPEFQHMTETAINNCCAEVTGHPGDYTYGPFLMNRRVIPHLALLEEEIGWGWRLFAFVISHRLGYELHEQKGDYFCPPDQRQDDPQERIYRMHQLSQSVKGIVIASKFSLEV